MRKYGLLAAAAGLALGGSVANADFVITSSRVALTGTTDQVTFSVQNNGLGNTAGFPNLQAFSAALYAPTSFNGTSYPGNGLFILANGSGKVFVNSASQSRFIDMSDGFSTMAPVQANPSILNLDGSVSNGSTGYTNGQQVAGIGLALGVTSSGIDDSSAALPFAIAVVPTGDPVEVLQTTPTADVGATGNRIFAPTFQATATEWGANNGTSTKFVQASNNVSAPFSDPAAVPEPTSLGLIGLAVGGLFVRRRRSV